MSSSWTKKGVVAHSICRRLRPNVLQCRKQAEKGKREMGGLSLILSLITPFGSDANWPCNM